MLRARGLCAVGELGRKDFVLILKDHLNEDDENCRFSAVWYSAIFGNAAALPVLRNIAEGEEPHPEKACCTALRLMHLPDAHGWL